MKHTTILLFIGTLLGGCLGGQTKKTHFQLGVEYYDAGDFADAAHEFEMACAESAKNRKALFNQGLSFLKINDYGRAAHVYERYVVDEPDNVYAHINLAHAYAGMNDDTQAIQHFEQAIQLDKTYAYPYCSYAQYLMQKGTEASWMQARQLLEKATYVERKDSSAHYLHGLLAEHFGNHEQAKMDFQTAVNYDNENQQALVKLAGYEAGEGQHADALGHYMKAAVLDSRDGNAWLGAANCFRHQGNYTSSLRALWKAQELMPDSIPVTQELLLTSLRLVDVCAGSLLTRADIEVEELRRLQSSYNECKKLLQDWEKLVKMKNEK